MPGAEGASSSGEKQLRHVECQMPGGPVHLWVKPHLPVLDPDGNELGAFWQVVERTAPGADINSERLPSSWKMLMIGDAKSQPRLPYVSAPHLYFFPGGIYEIPDVPGMKDRIQATKLTLGAFQLPKVPEESYIRSWDKLPAISVPILDENGKEIGRLHQDSVHPECEFVYANGVRQIVNQRVERNGALWIRDHKGKEVRINKDGVLERIPEDGERFFDTPRVGIASMQAGNGAPMCKLLLKGTSDNEHMRSLVRHLHHDQTTFYVIDGKLYSRDGFLCHRLMAHILPLLQRTAGRYDQACSTMDSGKISYCGPTEVEKSEIIELLNHPLQAVHVKTPGFTLPPEVEIMEAEDLVTRLRGADARPFFITVNNRVVEISGRRLQEEARINVWENIFADATRLPGVHAGTPFTIGEEESYIKEVTLEVLPLKFMGMSGEELTEEQMANFRGKILAGNVEIENWPSLNGRQGQHALGIDVSSVSHVVNRGIDREPPLQLTQEECAQVARNGLTYVLIDPNAAQEGAGAQAPAA